MSLDNCPVRMAQMRCPDFLPRRSVRTSAGARALARGAVVMTLLALSTRAVCAAAQEPTDLGSLSLEDLAKVVVSSVTKNPEPLSKAPAAVYVISHDDIMRSGA